MSDSIATRSLQPGFPPDTLAREATAELGIPAENLTVHDFDVRAFPEHRHEILELLTAVEKHASQQHRRYANADYIWSVARTHRVNVNREYAEVFKVYRVVA